MTLEELSKAINLANPRARYFYLSINTMSNDVNIIFSSEAGEWDNDNF